MLSKKLLLIIAIIIAAAILALFVLRSEVKAPGPSNNQQPNEATQEHKTKSEKEPDTFNKQKHSIDEPGSIWQIVNKNRRVPANYVPADLIVPDVTLRLARSSEQMKFRQIAEQDLIDMFKAARQDGVQLVFGSGYRSYALQKQFYDSYVARDGQEAADRYSARPGTSEHQTGLSFDVTSPSQTCHLEICFKDTPQGQWVEENAHKYGFIIRYLEGKEDVTGYQYEPWHLRYVGKELAAEVNKTSQTLEEFFGLN